MDFRTFRYPFVVPVLILIVVLTNLQACSIQNTQATTPPAAETVVKASSNPDPHFISSTPASVKTTINWHSNSQQHEAAEQLLRLLRVMAYSGRVTDAEELWDAWPRQHSIEQREQHLFQSLVLALTVYDDLRNQPYAQRHRLLLTSPFLPNDKRHQQLQQLASEGALFLLVDELLQKQSLLMVDASFDRLLPFTELSWPALEDIHPLYFHSPHAQRDEIYQRLIWLGDLWQGADELDFEEAIRRFQRRHGLKDDGAVGRQTRFWLNQSPEQRIQLLANNWLRHWAQVGTRTSTHRIEVNIPAFEMRYWQNGEAILDSRVIVGMVDRPTPLLQATITSLKVNPNWNVPVKIMWEDLLPKQKVEQDFLQRRGIRIKTSWINGQNVAPETIDWVNLEVKQFPYRLVQPPGKDNALGMVKFNMTNRKNIFLHHTAQPWLFNRHKRAFSSGCIRVEHAGTLAELMISNQDKAREGWFMARETGETRFLHLNSPVEVYITYRTAWVDDYGNRQFRHDMYGWNPPLVAPKPRKTVSYFTK